MARNGANVPVTVVSRTDDGFGDNTVVWEMPAGHGVANGSHYRVTVSGVAGAAAASHSYDIIPFDPSSNAANVTVTQAAIRLPPRRAGTSCST